MRKSVLMVIADIFRWIIALITIPVIVWLLFLFFMYPFEWLLSISTNWWFYFYVLFWFIVIPTIIGLINFFGLLIFSLATYLIRQRVVYAILLSLAILGLVGFCIYGAWSDNVGFSWEVYRYAILNKIIFTFLILSLLLIPLALMGSD